MRRILSFLKQSLSPPQPSVSPEALRNAFKRRYEHFRGLLTANNNALQAMADLEKIYYSGESYRMAAIHSKITTILVNVYKMVRNLLEMSDGKYAELQQKLEKISSDLDEIIEKHPPCHEGPFILPLTEVNLGARNLVGDKMARLGDIAPLSAILVPQGFVVTASATRHFLTSRHIDEINRKLQMLDPDDLDQFYKTCAEMQKIVTDSPLPPDLEELLHVHYRRLEQATHPGCLVALRSSALGEDSTGVSFAGLYRTALNVDGEKLCRAYKKIIASKYGPKATSYRRKRGYRHLDIEMCVGCMVMVDALVSGVTYSMDPSAEKSTAIRINAASGIARGVVDGTTATDLFLISREKPFPLVHKELRQGLSTSANQEAMTVSLTDAQLRKLAETALLLENHFGEPQDIEWSFDRQGRLFILQSRPIPPHKTQEKQEAPAPGYPREIGEPPFLVGGICASDGYACGEIFRVDSPEELRKFPQGAVLVLHHPSPEWAPLLGRASAVIAENGTEAGHLATIAREFGIPALFSLPRAMSTLENGQVITVDSGGRAIYRGSRKDLLRKQRVRKDIMAGSPVQRILTMAMQHITPLNLNDPAASHFKSSWCETLHDITRFCHEKSVSEMFNFGQEHHFDKGSAKQLIGEAALEWWVIDLADGFRKGLDEKTTTVRIEDIVSLPMLAIWKGISAFPWDGPPPISARGFGSIILQSAMRPDLDPTVPSGLTTKNYFLISENFCNLSVRLGYHYAMIETYMSDLLTESYVTFRFKGGAADLRRKAVRAKLLADILQKFDFRVELHSDALLARVKKKPRTYLEQRLQILGYLTLHARQLDMIMDQPQAVEQYREKFLADIKLMLSRNSTATFEKSGHE